MPVGWDGCQRGIRRSTVEGEGPARGLDELADEVFRRRCWGYVGGPDSGLPQNQDEQRPDVLGRPLAFVLVAPEVAVRQ